MLLVNNKVTSDTFKQTSYLKTEFIDIVILKSTSASSCFTKQDEIFKEENMAHKFTSAVID